MPRPALAAAGPADRSPRAAGSIYGWFTEGFDTADVQEAEALLEELGGERERVHPLLIRFAQHRIQGAFLFSVFGALAQYERALTQERIQAGLAAAKRRGKMGGLPQAISDEQLIAIQAARDGGASKAAISRTFGGVKRTTLYTDCHRGRLAGGTGRYGR